MPLTALVHTLLHESRISDAATRANEAVADGPRSAAALTALAEVHTVNPANDIQRIEGSLATMNDLDPEIREKAQASANSMMSLLSENSQTCQCAPITVPVTLPLIPAYENVKQISDYKLEVDFPKGKAKLTAIPLHPVFISAGHWPRPITFNTQKAHLPRRSRLITFKLGHSSSATVWWGPERSSS